MPQITSLKSQRNKKRVNLFLDGKFAFGLSLDEVLQNSLSVGKNLTENQVGKLFNNSQKEKLYQKTLNFLSYRPRSEKEIKDYLRQKLFTSSAIASPLKRKIQTEVLRKIKKLKLINDLEFAKWWVEQRMSHRPKGKRMLRMELRQKGIAKDIIEAVLLTVDDQQLTAQAKKVVDKKMRVYKNLSQLKLRQKLFAHLVRRGFDFALAKKVIDEKMEK